MKRMIALLCVLPLLLGGCSGWLDGSYHSVTPHKENSTQLDPDNMSATDYDGLLNILTQMIRSGTEEGVITLDAYNRDLIAGDMENAIRQITANDPLAAYAVNNIQYELGTSAGKLAAAVTIDYSVEKSEIRKVITVPSTNMAKDVIANALNQCDTGVVLYINNYTDADFTQYVNEYADLYPDRVIECPAVTANVYPQSGTERVLEVRFTYQNSTDTLKNMQKTIEPIFEASTLLVSGTGDEYQKFSQLYALLMNRFDYQIQTSATPAYSLLEAGIGDARAFAIVFGAMCRRANLDCQIISGTKDGQPWHWNIVRIGERYYHLDLLQCKENGAFRLLSSDSMDRYTWEEFTYPISSAAS